MTKKKRNRKSKKNVFCIKKQNVFCKKKTKSVKNLCCNICPHGKVYSGPSGLWYHMKKYHGYIPNPIKKQKTYHDHIPNPRKKQKLPLPLPFCENISLRRSGCNAPKKPKKDSTKIGTTTSDFVKRRLNMVRSCVPCIEYDFWSEENECRREKEVLIEMGRKILSQSSQSSQSDCDYDE